jgi:hypothetical protein
MVRSGPPARLEPALPTSDYTDGGAHSLSPSGAWSRTRSFRMVKLSSNLGFARRMSTVLDRFVTGWLLAQGQPSVRQGCGGSSASVIASQRGADGLSLDRGIVGRGGSVLSGRPDHARLVAKEAPVSPAVLLGPRTVRVARHAGRR